MVSNKIYVSSLYNSSVMTALAAKYLLAQGQSFFQGAIFNGKNLLPFVRKGCSKISHVFDNLWKFFVFIIKHICDSSKYSINEDHEMIAYSLLREVTSE